MRIIFLDFDGCVALTGTLEPYLVQRIQRLAAATDAKVVLTTSWRESLAHPHEELRQQLHANGLDQSHVIGQTPVLHGQTRGEEIAMWLNAYAHPTRVAILDDNDTGKFDMDPVRAHLIKTDPAFGITPGDSRRARALLTAGPVWDADIPKKETRT